MQVLSGGPIPLNLQLWDGNAAAFVKAFLFNTDGSPYSTSSVTLNGNGTGLYANDTVIMPSRDLLSTYVVYIDSSFSIQDTNYLISSEEITLSERIEIQRDQDLNHFTFPMTDNINHNPLTGLDPLVQVSVDGGPFVNSTNNSVEVGGGIYQINLTALELNGEVITLELSATNADTRFVTIVTQG